MDVAGDGEASLAALVEGYAALPPDDPRELELLLRIGQRFRERWRFPELAMLTRQAAERWPDAVRSAAWTDLRADVALARRDLPTYVAEVDSGLAGVARESSAPVVQALAELRFPPLIGTQVVTVDVELSDAVTVEVGGDTCATDGVQVGVWLGQISSPLSSSTALR